MNAQWNRYVTWFDARNLRERTVIGVAVIGCILLLGIDQWVSPAVTKLRALSIETAQGTQNAAQMKAQIVQLEKQLADPDAVARASLAQLQKQLTEQEPRLRRIQSSLVPAERMAQFLKSLLARGHSLQLLSLNTLPPAPVDNGNANSNVNPQAGLYKHGVEVSVSGSYADMVSYLSALESAPQKLVWERLELQSDEYPRCVVTLTVYTLSLDKLWLVI